MAHEHKPQPPLWAQRLLHFRLSEGLSEEIQGDLDELFDLWVDEMGIQKARWKYIGQVLGFLRPLPERKEQYVQIRNGKLPPAQIDVSSNSFQTFQVMLQNYIKIAWRNLLRNRTSSAVNIIGLAVGMATCLLLVLFVLNELSYDRYHTNSRQMYRMTMHGQMGGKEINTAFVSALAGIVLAKEYSGVEAATRLRTEGSFIIKSGNESFKEEHVAFVDSNFFQFFTIPLVKGNIRTALTEPNALVISETIAYKYFGNEDPIGKSLTLGRMGLFKISGVCKDVPTNTHFHYDFFGSFLSINPGNKWLNSGAYTYLKIEKGYPIDKLRAQSAKMVEKYIGPEIKEFVGIDLKEFIKTGNRIGFNFQPVTDIHLHSDLEGELEANGNISYVYIFSVIAGFILLLASINFMNLSTAGSSARAREVGVRKVLGSVQRQLIGQFLTESVLLVFLSLGVALGLVLLLLPGFNQLSGKQFGILTLASGWMLPGIILSALCLGLIAGSYPALFLSSFAPIQVLKGKLQTGLKTGGLRNVLVTIQFVVSVCMIIGTIVVYQQLHFIQSKKIGFDKEQVLVINDTYVLKSGINSFKNEIEKLASVERASLAGYLPAGSSSWGVEGIKIENHASQSEVFRSKAYWIDEDYLPTLGIQLAQGRNFSKDFPSDSAGALINETAARIYGLKNPIGTRISTVGDRSNTYTIVGVVKDFHFESMHQQIAPMVIFYGGDNGQIAIRLKTANIPDLLSQIEERWKKYSDNPFSYSFLDDRFNAIYSSEQRIGKLFGVFAGLAIFIACLGLYGLAWFVAEQRTKEIGIRKVLGATVSSIVVLLSRDFIKLVIIAMLIATPIAWYGMHQWLQDFAYHIDIQWWIFVLAGLLAISIALFTVSFQSIKAALTNPVKSLRNE
ncbi:ABC transporter permease [Cytophagaceae bacterium DM2B3-1]|uniref:ABC transporter permease n=1 Tax=Xanthocytophaga flava TaxID=3048013 RepID=A0ABT7CSS0_9BACT|nr:ABC transporter permease [Xanthocytophaga flavus]MDJ1496778.1 ABC transporter permease [Xanthocytophaga flavus]